MQPHDRQRAQDAIGAGQQRQHHQHALDRTAHRQCAQFNRNQHCDAADREIHREHAAGQMGWTSMNQVHAGEAGQQQRRQRQRGNGGPSA